LVAAVAAFAFVTLPARADDVADCKSDAADVAIAGCSKILKRQISAQDKASAYSYLARANMRKGQPDEAFAHATRAIDADPKNGFGYYARASVFAHKGDLDRGMEDLNKAIQLNPKYAWAYHGRGALYNRKREFDRAITEFNRAIELDAKIPNFYFDRASAYGGKDQIDRGIADCNKAVAIDAKYAPAYYCLGALNARKGEFDRAMNEYGRAIEVNPRYAMAYAGRGNIHAFRGETERALAELGRALEFDPKFAGAYAVRGRAFQDSGDLDRAMADAQRALELDPRNAMALKNRGMIYAKRGQADRALADLGRAIEVEPREAEAYSVRAEINMKSNRWDLAIADLRKVLSLPARNPRDRDAQIKAAELLTQLTQGPGRPTTPATQTAEREQTPIQPVVTSSTETAGRRVALVIGNSAYRDVGALRNPSNDARLVAAALRRVGFSDVIEKYDLGLAQMVAALKEFGDLADKSDWAVIYFAGHGVEMNGVGYLIPVDAKLEKDAHVPDETVALDRMIQKAETARKLRLIIIDACRNNPFATRMARTGGASRTIGRGGMPAIEPEGDILVAYATKHGTVAMDGAEDNSPFAKALADNIPAPGLDIRVMFGKVRDSVRKATANQQEPYTYGSIGGDLHYFAVATASR
jgi:tetratricopeptide (TPR) repeat protein